MQRKRLALLAVSVFALAGGSFLTSSTSADAHERRAVGAYSFVVGWLNEPALINQPNAVDLRVSRAADATPVTGLEQTLKVSVKSGEQTTNDVQLRPRFNTPGASDGRLIPTATGVYVFTITGTIEGQQINEVFTAGPGTFGLIEEGMAFPNELPTNQDLEERLVLLEADGGDGGSDNGTVFGIIGIVIGALGLAVAGIALTKKSA